MSLKTGDWHMNENGAQVKLTIDSVHPGTGVVSGSIDSFGAIAARHYLCVSFKIRPSAGSIRYAVSPLPAITLRAPLTVGTVAVR